MTIATLVDAFVEKVNSQPREPMRFDEVPEFLREGMPEALRERIPVDWTSWRIVKSDNSASIDALQNRLGRRFPASFLYFISNYCFPAFESGPLMFFANTGQDNYWELSRRLFAHPHMSPVLLDAGFIQIGEPFFYNYDPVCFDSNATKNECRIVQLDHESILQFSELKIVKEIAPSFIELLKTLVKSVDT
jgi:hypothetical protein